MNSKHEFIVTTPRGFVVSDAETLAIVIDEQNGHTCTGKDVYLKNGTIAKKNGSPNRDWIALSGFYAMKPSCL